MSFNGCTNISKETFLHRLDLSSLVLSAMNIRASRANFDWTLGSDTTPTSSFTSKDQLYFLPPSWSHASENTSSAFSSLRLHLVRAQVLVVPVLILRHKPAVDLSLPSKKTASVPFFNCCRL